MGNIVGEGFNPIIIDQINQRQKIYGSINRTNEILNYINNNTGWCRLVSSVNVVESPPNRNLPNTGKDLAKNFILFNGTSKQNGFQRGGIWPGTGNNNNFAYGMGGTNFGLRPMPGITQATIKTETRGSLKTATISIIANNREQFDIIDILYLRLGYTMLLEWGISSYFTNEGEYISDNPYSLVNDFLNGNNFNYNNYSKRINDKRLESQGNYDAIIGKVVNFNWTFTKEGTYNITIILRSMGDVIESLKINALLPGNSESTTSTPQQSPNPTPEDVILSFSEVHQIGRKFNSLLQTLKNAIRIRGVNSNIGDFTNSIIAFKQKYEGIGDQYYINLGYFLKYVEKVVIPYVNDAQSPLIQIDTDIKSNIIYLQSRQISSNPEICMFKSTWNLLGKKIEFAPECDDFVVYENKNRYGQIMNAYFNMSWILTTLNSLKDENGKVSLYDLINNLCIGWNNSTGNFNQLEPIIDEEENIVKIIDKVSLPNKDYWLEKQEKSTKTAVFNIYGYYPNQNPELQTAGFVKDLSFNTTISPNLATMITIGATSKGYVVGQDSTALSRMNAGLVDSFKPNIETHQDTNTANTGSINENYKEAIKAFNTFITTLGSVDGSTPKLDKTSITNFTNLASTLYEYDQAKQTLEKAGFSSQDAGSTAPSSPNIGFLPFDLQLTMDGLSGMKVYQKYTIDTTYLPTNYPTSLEFLIKGITNTIQNNEWTTTIESIAIPKNPFGSVFGENAVERSSNTRNTDTNYSQGSIVSTLQETNEFLNAVLVGIGIPNPNESQLRFMQIWRQHEGGKAAWNPFNTTLNTSNSTPYNYVSVKNYSSREEGLRATINTLGNSRYSNVVKAIKNIKREEDINNAISAVNSSPWGSKIIPSTSSSYRTFNNLIYKSPTSKRS